MFIPAEETTTVFVRYFYEELSNEDSRVYQKFM